MVWAMLHTSDKWLVLRHMLKRSLKDLVLGTDAYLARSSKYHMENNTLSGGHDVT